MKKLKKTLKDLLVYGTILGSLTFAPVRSFGEENDSTKVEETTTLFSYHSLLTNFSTYQMMWMDTRILNGKFFDLGFGMSVGKKPGEIKLYGDWDIFLHFSISEEKEIGKMIFSPYIMYQGDVKMKYGIYKMELMKNPDTPKYKYESLDNFSYGMRTGIRVYSGTEGVEKLFLGAEIRYIDYSIKNAKNDLVGGIYLTSIIKYKNP